MLMPRREEVPQYPWQSGQIDKVYAFETANIPQIQGSIITSEGNDV